MSHVALGSIGVRRHRGRFAAAVGVLLAALSAAPPLPAVAAATDQVAGRTTGTYFVAPGGADAAGSGRVVKYLVEVEFGLPVRADAFAAAVHQILNDPLGWGHGGRTIRFVRVDHGPVALRVSLSSPRLTDRQCAPLRTFGKVSCFNGRRAVINSDRWLTGSSTYGRDVADYRIYQISHEVGHALGHRHVHCPRVGAPAPVMLQQTKSLEGCKPNWLPYGAGPATARG